ncbi:putative membrane protein [Cricetibacter osteomyelitidis]|uniref:Putative membrane protein n=1 Tax=Cricetibacter osteomyelitidis TaxID=1521931 RepID=A0A4R2SZD3_9PAST|nr:hypothetical protein [Cricetibacter osteomyelitidis]TCP94895.1 putative membrane protein [Cricetibacter osteomyelitidis]
MNKGVKIAVGAAVAVLSVSYPFLLYFAREYIDFRYLLLLMLGLWLLRSVWQKNQSQQIISWVISLFLACSWFINNENLMYWYPVLISGAMFFVFAMSLFSAQSMIERFARLQYSDLPPEGVIYTRQVTKIWLGFFMLNSAITIVLIYWDKSWWAIYTGLISYLLMGGLFAGEWCYRKFKLKI